MFPISFNAFGDIVTAAQILYDVAKSLSETHGAPEEYRRFVEYLHNMGALMMQCHSVITSAPPNAEIRDAVLSKIQECYSQLAAGLGRVAKLDALAISPEPGSMSPGQVIRRGFHKVEWHFRYRGDVAKGQEEMQMVLQSLQVVVAFANLYVRYRISMDQDPDLECQLHHGGHRATDVDDSRRDTNYAGCSRTCGDRQSPRARGRSCSELKRL